MLFNSPLFFLFFPTVVLLFFAFPKKWRWLLLLIASCLFYMVFIPKYIFILWLIIVIDYTSGLLIEKSESKRKKFFFLLSIISNVGILFLFKYYNFFQSNLVFLAEHFDVSYSGKFLSFVLPLGISFHTFQSLSYIVEVYRGNQKAERHFGIYALYVLFFPQLVAGPIERPQNLLHQFHSPKDFDQQNALSGLRLMLFGFFKKIIIANNAAVIVNFVYLHPNQSSGWPLVIAVFLFSFQIYCDFSGYSDIARGAARMFGIELMKNFDRPYFSKSISEFWKRWHISLSTWFRDYIYFPLGGSRVKLLKVSRNIFVVFLLSGLWHGASWNFVIWGFLHGLFLTISAVTATFREKQALFFQKNLSDRWYSFFRVIVTFVLVSITWVFFRAGTLQEALFFLSQSNNNLEKIFNFSYVRYELLRESTLGVGKVPLFILFTFIFILLCVEYSSYYQKNQWPRIFLQSRTARWSFYFLTVFLILFFGNFGSQPFIYFQF